MSTTIKLNSQHRASIRTILLKQKFDVAKKVIEKKKQDILISIYDRHYSQATQHSMNQLAKGWLPEVHTIRARLGTIDFGHKLSNDRHVRVLASDLGNNSGYTRWLFVTTGADLLADQASEIQAEENRLTDEEDSLRRQIGGVLASATTANRLITIWPEIKPVVDLVVGSYVPAPNLPVVQVKDLNVALGLLVA